MVPAPTPDNLSSVLGAYMIEQENQLLQVTSDLHMYTVCHPLPHARTDTKYIE